MEAQNKCGRGKRKTCINVVFIIFSLFVPSVSIADIVNSNYVVLDDIQYYIQTNKSVYGLDEDVEMLYRVTNLGNEDITFGPLPVPEWNFWVDKESQNIWRAVNIWTGEITEFTLSSGEFKEFPSLDSPYIWDMLDANHDLVEPGVYDVIGGLYDGSGTYDHTKVSVTIEIVPEPLSILLLATGAIGIILFKHKRTLNNIS